MGPPSMSSPDPFSLRFAETPCQESGWFGTTFLTGCDIWSPGASWGVGLQHAGTGGCRGGPPTRDPPSWESGFIISLSLQAPAWTCGTCWIRARWLRGHGETPELGGTWRQVGLEFRRDWLFLHLLLSWLPASNGVALGVPSLCWNARRCTPTFSVVPWSRYGPSPSVLLNQKLRDHLLSKARLLSPVLSHFPGDPTLARVPSSSGASLSTYKWHLSPSI